MSDDTKNREVKWGWCQYTNMPGFVAVRKVVEEDYCYFRTQAEAEAFIRTKIKEEKSHE